MKIRLADYIANFLADHGVTDCFTVVGGGAMHLNDAFGHNERIAPITITSRQVQSQRKRMQGLTIKSQRFGVQQGPAAQMQLPALSEAGLIPFRCLLSAARSNTQQRHATPSNSPTASLSGQSATRNLTLQKQSPACANTPPCLKI